MNLLSSSSASSSSTTSIHHQTSLTISNGKQINQHHHHTEQPPPPPTLHLKHQLSFNSLETDPTQSTTLPSTITTIHSDSSKLNSINLTHSNSQHPLILNHHHSLTSSSSSSLQNKSTNQPIHQDSFERNSHPSSPDLMDATRPTLKRLTQTDQSSSTLQQSVQTRNGSAGMWFGSFKDRSINPKTHHSTHPHHDLLQLDQSQSLHVSDQLDKGKGKAKATPLADNLNRIKGAKDVLIHSVEKNDTIQGIALSYGISLSALRKANGMWTSDPLSLKNTLRIPLELCNLPPSKKIEIEEDSGKVLVWEQASSSSRSSSPNLISNRPSHRSSSNPLGPVNSHSSYLNQQQNCSRISLEMSASAGTSSEAGLSPQRMSFEKLSSFANPMNSSDDQEKVSNYLTGINFSYPISQLPSPPPPPLDEGLAYVRNPGVLTSISNTISPPSQSGSHLSNGQPKIIATLERVPAHELGFFTSNSNSPNPHHPFHSSDSLQPDSTTLLSNQTSNSLALNLTPNLPAHSTLRQRSATTNHRTSQSPNHSSPARHHTTPDPSTRPIELRSHSNQTHHSPRKQVGRLQFDYEPASIDPSQISPGLEKKRAAAKLFQVRGELPSVSNRGGVTGAHPHPESHQRNRSSNETHGSSSYPIVTHPLPSSSKWTTVRPGVPPPLNKRLQFLEEGPMTNLGKMFQGIMNGSSDSLGQTGGRSESNEGYKIGSTKLTHSPHPPRRLELNEMNWIREESIPLEDQSNRSNPNRTMKRSQSDSFWGFWNDLLDEAHQAHSNLKR
ncbi:hypothetical protein DFH28DRAFT_989936 [Melampsora americana]|nr:hypothetical protein DFH28DRAFT_989936 [Melampsora americana]